MRVNLSIARKGLILISVPFLFQLAFGWVTAEMQSSNAAAQAWASQSKEVVTQARIVLRSLVDAETGIRGFAITGDPLFTEPYNRATQEVPNALQRLQTLVRDNPDQEARAQTIAAKATQLMALHAEKDRMLRSGASDQIVPRTREGKRRMDDIRRDIDAFLEQEQQLVETRELALERSRHNLNSLLLAGGGLSLLCTAALAFIFSRSIGRRIRTLTENARRLARGNELASPLAGSDEITQLDGVFHDMASELRRSAVDLRNLNQNLEQRVVERTDELAKANRQLTQKNQENEMFVYSVSHDLRSPLVNLEGFSKELGMVCQDLRSLLAEDSLPPAVRERGLALLDGDMKEAIRFIQTGVRRLSNIIDALLRLSRAGRVQYQSQVVEANSVVGRVVDSMRATITEKGATITVAELPPVWGDPGAVEQVFANLISNALNYLDPKRPGVIEVGSDSAALPPDDSGSLALQAYYVKDNGLGIPRAYLAKVFQAFQRLHPGVAKGEGIGLALVRRMVEQHGGRIWLESTEGAGTTFWVTLPVPLVNGTANDFEPHEVSTNEWEDATWQPSRS